MTSRPKQAAPRPVPRLYLTTPAIVDPSAFSSQLTAALDAGDVAAVLLRFAGTDGDCGPRKDTDANDWMGGTS